MKGLKFSSIFIQDFNLPPWKRADLLEKIMITTKCHNLTKGTNNINHQFLVENT